MAHTDKATLEEVLAEEEREKELNYGVPGPVRDSWMDLLGFDKPPQTPVPQPAPAWSRSQPYRGNAGVTYRSARQRDLFNNSIAALVDPNQPRSVAIRDPASNLADFPTARPGTYSPVGVERVGKIGGPADLAAQAFSNDPADEYYSSDPNDPQENSYVDPSERRTSELDKTIAATEPFSIGSVKDFNPVSVPDKATLALSALARMTGLPLEKLITPLATMINMDAKAAKSPRDRSQLGSWEREIQRQKFGGFPISGPELSDIPSPTDTQLAHDYPDPTSPEYDPTVDTTPQPGEIHSDPTNVNPGGLDVDSSTAAMDTDRDSDQVSGNYRGNPQLAQPRADTVKGPDDQWITAQTGEAVITKPVVDKLSKKAMDRLAMGPITPAQAKKVEQTLYG